MPKSRFQSTEGHVWFPDYSRPSPCFNEDHYRYSQVDPFFEPFLITNTVIWVGNHPESSKASEIILDEVVQEYARVFPDQVAKMRPQVRRQLKQDASDKCKETLRQRRENV